MNIVNSFFTVVSHIKQWVPETYTLILFSLQKAPWPFRAVHVCLRIGLCTMENSTSWSIWSFCACLLYQMIRFDQLDDQKVCIVPTSATMNARMVQMLGLLWMKLVVPSVIEHASSVVILRGVLNKERRIRMRGKPIGSITQVGCFVSSHLTPPAVLSSPMNLKERFGSRSWQQFA